MLDVPQYPIHRDFNVVDIDEKLKNTSLYHNHTVQIIELVECQPPPRRIVDVSYASSSSYGSSSYTSEEDDEELECSSYCSSEDPLDASQPQVLSDEQLTSSPYPSSDTYPLRMKRILSWRKDFSSQLGSTLSEPLLSSTLKRKMSSYCGEGDDTMSHTSKRSRSHSSEAESINSGSLGSLSCPACDAFFDDVQSLRQHGRDAKAGANEACFTAVDYAFE